MRFWDASALVPMTINEDATTAVADLYQSDPGIVVWCLTPAEIWSAVCRRRREGLLGSPDVRAARQRLHKMSAAWSEVGDVASSLKRALRILEVHALRAGDALQLASALVAISDRPDGFEFVTLDERLGEAAEREGFSVVGIEPR